MASVQIRGDGVAACCCAHLLRQAGFRVWAERIDEPTDPPTPERATYPIGELPVRGAVRPPLPAILLGDRALDLLRDIFGRSDLLDGQPRIRKRVVAWGPGSEPRTFEHSAIVVSEQTLLDAIRPHLPPSATNAANWTIFNSPPLPGHAMEHRFGSRIASAAPVTLRNHSETAACWIEALDGGWLFLIAGRPAPACLLAVGGSPASLLARSRVIAPQIESCPAPVGEFPVYPRITSLLWGPTGGNADDGLWLACGSAAMALDPLCGDGVAHSIREAILAAAVIRAIGNGGDAVDLLSHYEARMRAAFERHLSLCLGFYRTGRSGDWWDSECRALEQGIESCRREIGTRTPFRYRLSGFELEPVPR